MIPRFKHAQMVTMSTAMELGFLQIRSWSNSVTIILIDHQQVKNSLSRFKKIKTSNPISEVNFS